MIKETIGSGEGIIVHKVTEGDEMAKPADMQCRALEDGARCENQISYNEDGDAWSVFCADHTKVDDEGRKSGKARPERFDRTELAEEADAPEEE